MAMLDMETGMTEGGPTAERRWARGAETEEEFRQLMEARNRQLGVPTLSGPSLPRVLLQLPTYTEAIGVCTLPPPYDTICLTCSESGLSDSIPTPGAHDWRDLDSMQPSTRGRRRERRSGPQGTRERGGRECVPERRADILHNFYFGGYPVQTDPAMVYLPGSLDMSWMQPIRRGHASIPR